MRLDHAVRKDLHGVGVQVPAGESLAQFHEMRDLLWTLRDVDVQRGEHAGGELAAAVEFGVRLEELFRRVGFVERGDAESVRHPEREPQAVEILGLCVLWQVRRDELRCVFAQRACGLAGGIPLDPAVGRIRRSLCNSCNLKGFRVRPRRVAIGGIEKRRTVGNDRIELFARRVGVWKERQLPAAASNPRDVRVRGGVRTDEVEHLGSRLGVVQVTGQHVHPRRDRVDVRIVEARKDHLAVELDDARLWSDERPRVAVGSDKDDTSVADGDRLGPAAGRVHGVDRAVAQHEVSGLRRNERKNKGCEYVHGELRAKFCRRLTQIRANLRQN